MSGEYFIGVDPGAGNGTPLTALDGAFDTEAELIQSAFNTASLSPGVTRLGLRFRDSQGDWGNPAFLDVQVEEESDLVADPPLPPGGGGLATLRTLAAAEYSVEGGSGVGLVARDGSFDTGAEETTTAALSVVSLAAGTHRLAMHFQDSEGRWGNDIYVDVVVEESTGLATDPPLPPGGGGLAVLRTLSAAEYSVDGGSSVGLAARDGSFDAVLEETATAALSAASLSAGTHRLAMRFQDSEGRWGNDTYLDVVVEESNGLVTDPPLPPGGGGLATLRTLSATEYSVDGGSGIGLAARDGSFDAVLEETATAALSAASLSAGTHRLGMRFQDSEGRWGNDTYLDVAVEESAELVTDPPLPPGGGGLAVLRTLSAAEYSVDGGSGVGLAARDGSFDAVLEETATAALIAASLSTGTHRLGLRFQDSEARWGNDTYLDVVVEERSSVVTDPPLPPGGGGLATLNRLVAAEFFVDDDPGPGDGTALLAADSAFDDVAELLQTAVRNVSQLAGGPHRVGLRFKDSTAAWGSAVYQGFSVYTGESEPPSIAVQPVTQIKPPGEQAIFSVLANGSEPLFYQWWKDSAKIPDATNSFFHIAEVRTNDAGHYEVVVTNFLGSITSQVATLVVPAVILVATTAGGGSVTLQPPGGAYRAGTIVEVTASPDTGWTFLGWTGDVLSTTPMLALTMEANVSVQAVFGTSLSTMVSGSGTVLRSPQVALFPYGTTVRLTAIPGAGQFFETWGASGAGTDNPLNFIIDEANPTFTCLFSPLDANQVALTLVADGFGSVTSSPSGNRFATGQEVTLTAISEDGQSFLGWSGDVVATDNPLAVILNTSKVIVASFTSKPRLQPLWPTGSPSAEGFRMLVTSKLGEPVTIQYSSNLTDWVWLLTVTNNYGTFPIRDTTTTNQPHRFYRAQE